MIRSRKTVSMIAVLAFVGGALQLGSGSAADIVPSDCVAAVPGVGPACRTADGLWQIKLPDGSSFFTHGGDAGLTSAFEAPIRPRPVTCATSPTDFRVEVFYAAPTDVTSRFSSMRAEITKMLEAANGILYDESVRYNRKLTLRALCVAGRPYVRSVPLTTTKSATHLGTVINDLRRAGYNDPFVKYWVWVDRTMGRVAGTGTFLDDDSLTSYNRNMYVAGYSAVWGYRLSQGAHAVLLHEGSHNFGGVPMAAQNTTGAGHCTDGIDVMCYNDGGPFAARYTTSKCTTRVAFDCGGNDYFNPAPSRSNMLSSNWNLGSPYNRFFTGCAYKLGNLTVGLTGPDPEASIPAGTPSTPAVIARTHTISSSCAGRPYAITGVLMGPPPREVQAAQGQTAVVPDSVRDRASGVVGSENPTDAVGSKVVPDLDVCFYKGSTLIKCVTGTTDRGTVPSGTTAVRVILVRGANVSYVFSAI